MEDIEIVTTYIAAWAWNILGMIFLNSSIVLLAMGKFAFALPSIVLFGGCEVMALIRKINVERNS